MNISEHITDSDYPPPGDHVRMARIRDQHKLQEVSELLEELAGLKADHPHSFELCIDTGAIQRIIDTLQDEVFRIRDEAHRGAAAGDWT